MENKLIKDLLDGFYEGTLTEEQEKELIGYFSNEIIDDELKAEKEAITFFIPNADIQAPESLKTKIEDIIQTNSKPKRNFKRWITVGSVAACLLVIIGIGFSLKKENEEVKNVVVLTEEEQIKLAQEKLIYVSVKLNEGLNSVTEMETQMNKVNKIINRKK